MATSPSPFGEWAGFASEWQQQALLDLCSPRGVCVLVDFGHSLYNLPHIAVLVISKQHDVLAIEGHNLNMQGRGHILRQNPSLDRRVKQGA